MTQLVTGKAGKLRTREAGNPGNTWTEETLPVVGWGSTQYVKVSKDLHEELPAEGEDVAIEVSVNTYVTKAEVDKARNGGYPRAGHELFGHRRNVEVEKSLFGAPAKLASVG